MNTADVTEKFDWDNPDDEFLPIRRCVCGAEFGYWEFSISIYDDTPKSCEKCGRKFYFRNAIRIFEVVDEN